VVGCGVLVPSRLTTHLARCGQHRLLVWAHSHRHHHHPWARWGESPGCVLGQGTDWAVAVAMAVAVAVACRTHHRPRRRCRRHRPRRLSSRALARARGLARYQACVRVWATSCHAHERRCPPWATAPVMALVPAWPWLPNDLWLHAQRRHARQQSPSPPLHPWERPERRRRQPRGRPHRRRTLAPAPRTHCTRPPTSLHAHAHADADTETGWKGVGVGCERSHATPPLRLSPRSPSGGADRLTRHDVHLHQVAQMRGDVAAEVGIELGLRGPLPLVRHLRRRAKVAERGRE